MSSSPRDPNEPPREHTSIWNRPSTFRWRLYAGMLILASLAVPVSVVSDRAIGSLVNAPDRWLPDDLPLKRDFTDFIRRFGITDVVMIRWPSATLADPAAADGRDDASLQKVVDLLRPLTAEHVASEATSESPIARANREFYREARRQCGGRPPLSWVRSGAELRNSLTAPPRSLSPAAAARRFSGTLIGDDGRSTCVIFEMSRAADNRLRYLIPAIERRVASELNIAPEQLMMVGGPVDGAAVDAESIASIRRFSVPSSLIAVVLCWLCLRSLAMTGVIVGVASIGQGGVLAGLYLAGIEISAVLIVLPPLVFVLTVSAGVHLSNYYLDWRSEHPKDPVGNAAAMAMRIGVPPCLVATFTTVVGLSSLGLVRLQPVRVFGLAGATAIFLTLGMLILMLPGAMTFCRRITSRPSKSERSNERSAWLRPTAIMLIFVAAGGLASLGLAHLRTTVRVTEMFGPESRLRKSYRAFESEVGATMVGDLLVEFPSPVDAINDPSSGPLDDPIDQYRTAIAIHAAVAKQDGIGGVLSSATFLPLPPRGRSLGAAAERQVLRGQIEDPQSSAHRLGYLRDGPDGRVWRISVRIPQSKPVEFDSLIDRTLDTARRAVAGSGASVRMTGQVVIVQRSQELLLGDLFKSFLVALAIIWGVMVVHLRSIIGGLLSMVPNVIPTLTLFGGMGWLGLPLDIGSVMTASVALGIAVDDTVHFLSRFRAMANVCDGDGHPIGRAAAAVAALRQCGWAMFQTTVICSLSLMVYALSPFVPTWRFAIFMATLLVIALAGVSALLPAIAASRAGRYLLPK